MDTDNTQDYSDASTSGITLERVAQIREAMAKKQLERVYVLPLAAVVMISE